MFLSFFSPFGLMKKDRRTERSSWNDNLSPGQICCHLQKKKEKANDNNNVRDSCFFFGLLRMTYCWTELAGKTTNYHHWTSLAWPVVQ
jgi:hypothetical protein